MFISEVFILNFTLNAVVKNQNMINAMNNSNTAIEDTQKIRFKRSKTGLPTNMPESTYVPDHKSAQKILL